MSTETAHHDNQAMQALSDAGAQCGSCGDEPGDRVCPDCERFYQDYVAALRAAGWAPRVEVLREAEEIAEQHKEKHFKFENYDEGHGARMVAESIRIQLRRIADEASA